MADSYCECLVKKEKTSKDTLIHYGLIALLVLAAAAGLFIHPVFLIAAVFLGIACWFFIPRTDLEYEYLFVNGEMDIDVVMAKTKRKRIKTIELSEVDLIAPLDSHRMDYYNSNSRMKILDFSSGNREHNCFAMISHGGNENVKIIIEPDEKLTQLLKNYAPGKTFLD